MWEQQKWIILCTFLQLHSSRSLLFSLQANAKYKNMDWKNTAHRLAMPSITLVPGSEIRRCAILVGLLWPGSPSVGPVSCLSANVACSDVSSVIALLKMKTGPPPPLPRKRTTTFLDSVFSSQARTRKTFFSSLLLLLPVEHYTARVQQQEFLPVGRSSIFGIEHRFQQRVSVPSLSWKKSKTHWTEWIAFALSLMNINQTDLLGLNWSTKKKFRNFGTFACFQSNQALGTPSRNDDHIHKCASWNGKIENKLALLFCLVSWSRSSSQNGTALPLIRR